MNGSASIVPSNTSQSLQDWLDAQMSRPDWPVLREMMASLLDAVEKIHAEKRSHVAISPHTVRIISLMPPQLEIVAPETVTAAAFTDPEASTYVAPELRQDGGTPTSASDMFGLAAIAYRIVTGRPFDLDAGEPLPHRTASHLVADDYPLPFLAVIDATLAVAPEQRPDITEWRHRALPMPVGPTASVTRGAAEQIAAQPGGLRAAPRQASRPPRRTLSRPMLGLAAGAALTMMLGTWLLVRIGSVVEPGQTSQLGPRPAGGINVPAPESLPAFSHAPADAAANAIVPQVAVSRERGLRSPFRDCDDCPEMVVIEPGPVRMQLVPPGGSQPRDYATTVPGPFAAGRFELTRGEFRAFVAATGFSAPPGCYVRSPEWRLDEHSTWQSPGYPQDDRHPVACVSFEDAKAYVAWLSGRTDKHYRLLSDAEWHLIASSPDVPQERGVGQCRFANGADQTAHAAEPRWVTADCDDGYHYTSPVGTFAATGRGLGDLFGNVWEWVDNCAPDFSGTAPVFGECVGDAPRILRGGSWSDRPEMLALDARILSPPHLRDQIAGVRIARDVSRCEVAPESCLGVVIDPPVKAKSGSTASEPVSGGDSAGYVEAIKGAVSATSGGQLRTLDSMDPLYIGDLVSTEEGARATLKLGQRTTLRLGERTRITLNRYVVDAGGEFELKEGVIQFVRTGPPATAPLTIRSDYGLIAVRGTQFFAGPSRGKFGVFVETGSVSVTAGGATVLLGPQLGTDVERVGAAPSNPAAWGQARIQEALALVH